ncbi:MAG: hypothetical protein WA213_18870 [Terriglobales bacterium]
MPFDIMPLVREVYRQSKRNGFYAPAMTRLVKLLYLADIEWRKGHNGEPLANLTWRFLHFGPYALELAEPLGGPEMEVKELEGGKEVRRFTFSEDELKDPQVPEEVVSIFAHLVKRWGGTDLNMLLDYVDTEPMEAATRGELLDFTVLTSSAPPVVPKFDSAKLNAVRSRIRERAKAMGLTREGAHFPSVDVASERAWDEDDRPVHLPVGGRVKLF